MFQCFNCSIHAKLLHSKSRNWMLTCRFRPVAVPSKWCNDCMLLSSAKPCPSWTKEKLFCIIQFSCHICIVETSSFNLLITRSCAFDVSHVYDFASLSHSCGFSCTICGGDRVQIDSHHYYIDGTDWSWILLFWRQRCRWFASQLAFLLSNIAEQKPRQSGMGGRYSIDYQLYYIWMVSASNFPKLLADKTQRTDRWAATVFKELYERHSDGFPRQWYQIVTISHPMWYHNNLLWYHNDGCDITTMDVISQRVVISQRWCEIPDLGIHIQKGGQTKHAP